MVIDIGCLRVKLMFSRGNYDMHSNKRKSDVSERILITKTNMCKYSVPHPPSVGASVDEYVNMSVFKTRFLMKPLIT